ncbi:hypothetical protein A9P82_03885 [Arachidicoccus ginsenosidimutans]|uniref:sialate O-acetylesterase n=1 Tax=Arachidicoccus sp. BS20 TaxID=1850526 RepID=UPI0007F0D9E1|nr:sialate O-acetylesterase [Arachidicoccus sp. BS20]ANI88513.1 hypothetical protein A9P82_03885 [Arachidicoccus sp. BS20]
MKKYFIVLATIFFVYQTKAQIRLPNILSDGMVLQQNSEVNLWGWGDPAEKISIQPSWTKDTVKTITDGNGKWNVQLHTPKAGGPYSITFKDYNTIVLHNVWLGEVWICSGQSNMEFTYNWRNSPDIAADFPTCNQLQLHFFKVPRTTAQYPQDNCGGNWLNCDSNTLKNFSAVAYFFGKKLDKNLNVPIGLISSNWGGTPAEVWTPKNVINKNPFLKKWQQKLKPSDSWTTSSGFAYNAMIYPLKNFKIAGAIWYQGESNVDTYQSYSELFKDLILSWRRSWHYELPFYFVQIAPFSYGTKDGAAYIRQAQTDALQLPNTGMVITSDLAEDTSDIHPHYKHEVGYRLAEIALNKTYHLANFHNFSPMYESYHLDKNKIVIQLNNAEQGVYCKDKTIRNMYIAGADSVFYPAETKLAGNTIIVYNKNIAKPKTVKYGFDNTRMGNIFSKGNNMPVAPFFIKIE